ncbi:hypothetical protein ACFOZY_01415 [Chungangia koreensis]|uniref:Flavoprotein n=1 Tax=Chungangia koreensis TaxID=752657 RepID=A0ABV8X4E5_9LACT
MKQSFEEFLQVYLSIWESSDLEGMKRIISEDYRAREITGEEILDFGFEESVEGWKNGFEYVVQNNAKWDISIHSVFPLRNNQVMAVIEAAMIIDKEKLPHANLFFSTFSQSGNEWKLVRSYIEAGVQRQLSPSPGLSS